MSMRLCIVKYEHWFQINKDRLAYSVEEFLGELYRLNTSCSSEELPESGCLFFKWVGTTNVTDG